jgi:RNA polymerase subunit RPABC4/transcription elongation factor Spt4
MENISNLIVTAVSIIGAITAAIIGGLTIWTFRDIRSRSRDVLVQILATIMVAVIPVAGILVYFMLRPRETLAESYVRALEEESLLAGIEHQEFCPSCGRRVDADMVFCPSCHTKLRNPCPNCQRAVHLSWDLCPYCGETLQPEMPVISKPARKRIPAAATQPHEPVREPLPASPPYANTSLPAGKNDPATSNIGNMLDRVGGVIEGLVDRLSSRGESAPPPSAHEAPPQPPAEPPQQPAQRTYTRPAESKGNEGNGDAPTKPTSSIKPLISREEPLE